MEFRAYQVKGGFVNGPGEFREYPKDFQEEEEMEDGLLENCLSYDDYRVTDINSDDMNVDSEDNEQSSDVDVDIDIDVDVERECKRTRGRYRQYSEKQRDEFWHLVIEGCPTYRASKELRIKLQTAYTWVQKENSRILNKYHGIEEEKPKKRGRKPLLNDEHKEFWSACKSKVKRSKLGENENLTKKIGEAASAVTSESYKGFCRHVQSYIQQGLDRTKF